MRGYYTYTTYAYYVHIANFITGGVCLKKRIKRVNLSGVYTVLIIIKTTKQKKLIVYLEGYTIGISYTTYIITGV